MEQHSYTGDYTNRYKFNGKELDEETGFYYYGARYYNPKFSIWLSTDPLAEKFPNASPYNYCLGNPIKLVDPDGRAPIDHYRLNRDGSLTFLQKTKGRDVIYSSDYKNALIVQHSFIQSKKVDVSSSSKWGTIKTSIYKVDSKDNSDKIFNFFVKHSAVEMQKQEIKINGKVESFISTANTSDHAGTGGYANAEYALEKDKNAKLLDDTHSHVYIIKDVTDFPSGFSSKGIPQVYEDGETFGDRGYYLNMKEKYNGRIPKWFNLFLKETPEKKVKYNDENFKRTN